MKERNALSVRLGNKYTATYQVVEWECSLCGHNNSTHQRIDNYDDLFDTLMYDCDLCGNPHLIRKDKLL